MSESTITTESSINTPLATPRQNDEPISVDADIPKNPIQKEVLLGGDRTALEMLNDLIFDDSSNDVTTSGNQNNNNLTPYITTATDSARNNGSSNNVDSGDNSQEPVGPYVVTPEDVAKLQRQVAVDDDRARELLEKHKGDQVAAMLDVYDVNYKPENPSGISMQHGMNKEDVVDLSGDRSGAGIEDEDVVVVDLMPVLDAHADDPINNYQYAMLRFNSDSFRPHKKHCKFPHLIRDVVLPELAESVLNNTDVLLEKCDLTPVEYNRVLGLDNDPVNTLKCMHLTGLARPVFKKWGMYECGMIYWESQVVSTQYITDNKCFTLLNKHATRLARLIGHLDDKQSIIGNCAIVNNCWFTS